MEYMGSATLIYNVTQNIAGLTIINRKREGWEESKLEKRKKSGIENAREQGRKWKRQKRDGGKGKKKGDDYGTGERKVVEKRGEKTKKSPENLIMIGRRNYDWKNEGMKKR